MSTAKAPENRVFHALSDKDGNNIIIARAIICDLNSARR